MPFLPEAVFKRRLESEHAQMQKSPFSFRVNSDLTEYEVAFSGKGFQRSQGRVTPIHSHRLRMTVKRDYPYAGGLELVWLTPLFHPNIRENDGKVCIQLVNEWAASQTLVSVCHAIQYMLGHPNPRSPLNIEAARFFDENPRAFEGQYAFKRPRIVTKGG
ncbi:ubiquitin-conjugating enzyme E2 [Candidatus Micrarchaeota archaeon]|nr:ubiquitin-conjugating enzyme E2 [Candidatus Micrarchaeota archaeon]